MLMVWMARRGTLVLIVVIGLLLPALAVMQYRWMGEISRLELGSRELQGESVFRTVVQVMDTGRNGRIRPCPALVSQRVFDRARGTTDYYVPARIQ